MAVESIIRDITSPTVVLPPSAPFSLWQVLPEALGAFLGAAFAFGFFLLSEALGRGRRRQVEHYNALVAADRDAVDWSIDSSFAIERLSAFRQTVSRKQIFWFWPEPIAVKSEVSLNLAEVHLITACARVVRLIRRYNTDLATARVSYEQLVQAHLQGKLLPDDDYVRQATRLADYLDGEMRLLTYIVDQSVSLLARIELQSRKDIPTRKPFWLDVQTGDVTDEEVKQRLPTERARIVAICQSVSVKPAPEWNPENVPPGPV